MSRLLKSVVAVGALAALPGCFYPAERGRALEARVETLTAKNQALETEMARAREDLSNTLPRIDEKVKQVTAALDSLDQASRRSDADASVQLQKTVEDVAQLRGQVETYLFKINELETQLRSFSDTTDQKLLGLQGDDARQAAETRRKVDELERPKDKKAFLQLADERRRGKDTAVARQLYSEWLKKWGGKDELTGEAHYGLGETYFEESKCREALPEYGKVIQDFTKAKVAPAAYLRSSDCFKQLKMEPEARLALEELVKAYPKSSEARTAKDKLAQLSKKKPASAPKKGQR